MQIIAYYGDCKYRRCRYVYINIFIIKPNKQGWLITSSHCMCMIIII